MSKPNFENEGKDVRYFPTDNEMHVLIGSLQVYFSHPERSIQRSQVVQNVVSVLSPANKHWNQRTVRLWFNNNKRVFLRPSSPGAGQAITPQLGDARRDDAHSLFQSQQRCFVPRPLSGSPAIKKVSHAAFIGGAQGIGFCGGLVQRDCGVKVPMPGVGVIEAHRQHFPPPPPPPKPDSMAFDFASENEHIMESAGDTYAAQSKSESVITGKIVALYEKKWRMFVEAQQARTTLVDSASPAECQSALELMERTDYDVVETSAITSDGRAAVVAYDADSQCQKLYFDGRCVDVNQLSPASSMALNENSGVVWVHSGCCIRGISMDTLENMYELRVSNRKSSKSVISFWGDNLVLAAGSTVLLWNQENMMPMDEKQQDTFNVCLNLSLPSISSLATVGDFLVVASSEYHTIQVYARNGAIVSRSIGHSCGVTTLQGYDENTFISGSADQTVKIWDLRISQPIFKIIKHKGVVTSVFGDCENSPYVIFTGGNDGYVKGWDIREFKHLFSKQVCSTSPQSINYNIKNQKLSVVTSEKTSDVFYDNGKFGSQIFQNYELPYNAVLQYQYYS